MFDELTKYKDNGHFFFEAKQNLIDVCNAPKDKSGLYVIYKLANNKVELIYIGISGRKGKDGNIIHRKGGLRGRFLTGKQFGDLRSKTWKIKMEAQKIKALDIYWYVTHDDDTYKDFPRDIEKILIEKFHSLYGRLPDWNKKF